jgi:hypothetical protein
MGKVARMVHKRCTNGAKAEMSSQVDDSHRLVANFLGFSQKGAKVAKIGNRVYPHLHSLI